MINLLSPPQREVLNYKYMKNYLIGIILSTLLAACVNNDVIHHYSQTNSKVDIVTIYNDERSFLWHGGGINLLCFNNKKVEFHFNATCMYEFDTKLQNDSIVIFWGLDSDCTFDRGISTEVDNILNPTKGDIFASCKIINDSVLMMDYHFEAWTSYQNIRVKDVDTLFPKLFFRLK